MTTSELLLRVARVATMPTRHVEPGSRVRACSRCGAGCLVSPQSLRWAPHARIACDRCLPAAPIDLPGTR